MKDYYCKTCGYETDLPHEVLQHTAAYQGHLAVWRGNRKAGGEVAKLYGSMSGARTAGLVGHDEMTAQVQTWKGVVRLWMDADGNFEVYVADQEGENGLKLIEGNANTRTATDSQGNSFQAAPLQDKLDPIVVKNRGKAYTQKAAGAPAPAPSRSPAAAAAAPPPTRAKPQAQTKQTKAPAQKMPSQQPKSRAAGPPTGRVAAAPPSTTGPGFNVSDFSVGDKVMLAKVGSSAMRAVVGEEGVIEKIRVKSPIGPQVLIEWENAGAGTVYPDQGDVIAK